LNAVVTDWTQVVDAHGTTGRVPVLLDLVEQAGTPAAWEELGDRLCLHGETVSPASFAALPRLADLADLAPANLQALELAGSIVRGTLQDPDGEALLAGCTDAIRRLRDLVDQRLRSRPADYHRVFGHLLALAGLYHWSAAIEGFTDDFYTVSCTHCGVEVTIAIGEYGCYSAIRDWDRGDVERRELLPAPTEELRDPGRWMHATAVRDGQKRLAAGIRYLFGRARCPACVSEFSISDVYTSANLPPTPDAF
jgi:hypothetical protein